MCCIVVYSDQPLVGSFYTGISYHDKFMVINIHVVNVSMCACSYACILIEEQIDKIEAKAIRVKGIAQD